jgi:hypothetical protein
LVRVLFHPDPQQGDPQQGNGPANMDISFERQDGGEKRKADQVNGETPEDKYDVSTSELSLPEVFEQYRISSEEMKAQFLASLTEEHRKELIEYEEQFDNQFYAEL